MFFYFAFYLIVSSMYASTELNIKFKKKTLLSPAFSVFLIKIYQYGMETQKPIFMPMIQLLKLSLKI